MNPVGSPKKVAFDRRFIFQFNMGTAMPVAFPPLIPSLPLLSLFDLVRFAQTKVQSQTHESENFEEGFVSSS